MFGVQNDKFLGFMVSERGIDANLTSIKTLLNCHIPASVKDIQRLLAKITALSRFISQYGNTCRPMFKLLMKQEREPGKARVKRKVIEKDEKPPNKLHSHGLRNARRLWKKARNTSSRCRR